jgi:hypothetical protein
MKMGERKHDGAVVVNRVLSKEAGILRVSRSHRERKPSEKPEHSIGAARRKPASRTR